MPGFQYSGTAYAGSQPFPALSWAGRQSGSCTVAQCSCLILGIRDPDDQGQHSPALTEVCQDWVRFPVSWCPARPEDK